MLQLKSITKTYTTGDLTQTALSGVTVNFRESEFVAVLGQSGSGKTTLLNIIGGLDRYDSGDLIINEKSTKEYKDANWDTYRNHSIGFVFQSYNLIPHQTVLSNVELALTLSGVPKAERKQRAKDVLVKVGLGDQLHKKPNQMSGGQMQRVAIARALVNNPDILLADEPTGALDSETSVQVINLLKEIAEDRLIIMVTHNPELAEQYANRIIHLKDGKIINDSNPYTDEAVAADIADKKSAEETEKRPKKKGKTSMNFFTALSLSLNNLLTKKARTFLTSFAGSIGIIGIALILSLSSGFQAYINSVQEDTLSSYPLSIETNAIDLSALMGQQKNDNDNNETTTSIDDGKIHLDTGMVDRVNTRSENTWQNNLKDFKVYLDENKSKLDSYINAIEYRYGITLNIYSPDTSKGVSQLNPSPLSDIVGGSSSSLLDQSGGDAWNELIDNPRLLKSQYDVLAGNWPKAYNEVVVIVDANNQIDELTMAALGIQDASDILKAMENDKVYDPGKKEFTYNEVMAKTFRLVLQPDYYSYDAKSKTWADKSEDNAYVKGLVNKGTQLKVAGIIKPKEQSVTNSSGSSIGYLKSLTEYVIKHTNSCEVVKQQLKNTGIDIFKNLPFETVKENKNTGTTGTKEEVTTAPAQNTTTAAATGKTFAAPAARSLGYNGKSASAAFVEATTSKAVTEDEVYAYIKSHFKGDERDKMLDFAKLILKDTRTLSEKKRLIGYLDEMLKGQKIEGMSNFTGQQVYTYYILTMNKATKLQMLGQIMEADGKPEQTTASHSKPETTTAPQNNHGGNTATTKPEQTTAQETTTEPAAPTVSDSTLKKNLSALGVANLAEPEAINLYPKNFEAKDKIVQFIKDYNSQMDAKGLKDNAIKYTDYIGLIMSSVTKIINIVSYVLIAFVSISLVVSSIMIGIITYISVLERTKEIGILRSIGASKRDISRVFNAETIIVGFIAGILGIVSTLLLCIPVNFIIEKLADISGVAKLPLAGGAALIAISMVLTTIAGLIPAKMAAKKDPVIALRTE